MVIDGLATHWDVIIRSRFFLMRCNGVLSGAVYMDKEGDGWVGWGGGLEMGIKNGRECLMDRQIFLLPKFSCPSPSIIPLFHFGDRDGLRLSTALLKSISTSESRLITSPPLCFLKVSLRHVSISTG